MIGQWLGKLSAEQEDRVLTQPLGPGDYGMCLVGRAAHFDSPQDNGVCEALSAPNEPRSWRYESFAGESGSVEATFDNLCERFGTARTATAIRSRILRNRLRRSLAPSSGQPAVAGAV